MKKGVLERESVLKEEGGGLEGPVCEREWVELKKKKSHGRRNTFKIDNLQ